MEYATFLLIILCCVMFTQDELFESKEIRGVFLGFALTLTALMSTLL